MASLEKGNIVNVLLVEKKRKGRTITVNDVNVGNQQPYLNLKVARAALACLGTVLFSLF